MRAVKVISRNGTWTTVNKPVNPSLPRHAPVLQTWATHGYSDIPTPHPITPAQASCPSASKSASRTVGVRSETNFPHSLFFPVQSSCSVPRNATVPPQSRAPRHRNHAKNPLNSSAARCVFCFNYNRHDQIGASGILRNLCVSSVTGSYDELVGCCQSASCRLGRTAANQKSRSSRKDLTSCSALGNLVRTESMLVDIYATPTLPQYKLHGAWDL